MVRHCIRPVTGALGLAAALAALGGSPAQAQEKGVLMVEFPRSAFPARAEEKIREIERAGHPARVWARVMVLGTGPGKDESVLRGDLLPRTEGGLRGSSRGGLATFGPAPVTRPQVLKSSRPSKVLIHVHIQVSADIRKETRMDGSVDGSLLLTANEYDDFKKTVEAQGAALVLASDPGDSKGGHPALAYKPLGLSPEVMKTLQAGPAETKAR